MLSATEFARRPRIIGAETEYSHPKNGQDLTDTGVARQLGEQFLANGGRRYVDINEIVEFATPECLGPLEAVLYERAGEQLVTDLDGSMIHKRLIGSGVRVDTNMKTAGHHESYLAPRSVPEASLETVLLAHCTSRIALNGAGLVALDEYGEPFFSVGQKVWGLYHAVSSQTTNDGKGIVNTRDEPHAGHDEYRRVHVISGDANMSDYATWLNLATTSLCLRLVEAGEDLGYLVPEVPVLAMRTWSGDTTLRHTFRTLSGKQMTAVDIQEALALQAQELVDKVELPEEEIAAIVDWIEVCDLLRTNQDGLIGKVDWITKRHLIQRKLGETSLRPETLGQAIQVDYAFDQLDHGYMDRLRQKGVKPITLFTNEQIIAAKTTPPNTRAKQRCKLAKRIAASHINWAEVSNNYFTYTLSDPYGLQPAKRTRGRR